MLKTAYEVVRNHAAASTEKRIEAEFHAGWIALRFLDDPATAAGHFADAAKIAVTPISIARTAYWQGRAAEAAGQADEARRFYERAAGVRDHLLRPAGAGEARPARDRAAHRAGERPVRRSRAFRPARRSSACTRPTCATSRSRSAPTSRPA